jgi:hypothetical protein
MGKMSELDIDRRNWLATDESREEARKRILDKCIGQLIIVGCDDDAAEIAEIALREPNCGDDEPQGFGRFSAEDLEWGDMLNHLRREDGE